ncbi:hypothetical protein DE146DRAFT_100591 [Phaeosphaeria sp. MPI-PUGE-AT-0046c]|nr:hypothetical protein DE146DRAFT_100591 [Phaeosphaeria sp. MPI-PUGE-AT-0046c]
MFLPRAVSSSFVCSACQRSAARSARLPINGTLHRATTTSTSASRKTLRRAFGTNTPLAKDRNDPTSEDPEFEFLQDDVRSSNITPLENLESSIPTTSEPTADSIEYIDPSDPVSSATTAAPMPSARLEEDTSIPWYLRQQSALREQTQKPIDIPDLPPNPPPLLKTILEFVSITAGLDDMELLDLRHLDPPPALGPKLIMIIATARSEKHLHVAADTFSRWLRREHGLKANAAGLLGRNELKIKLRRKAKRMRMMANVGGSVPEGNIDDGIRTGWICCTLSKIEAHPDDMHMPGDDVEEFVGFRDVKPGVHVVVQMFTEEKRAETGLETLWGGVLKTHQRQNNMAEGKLRESEEAVDSKADMGASEQKTPHNVPATLPLPPQPVRPLRSMPSDVFPPASNADAARQIRRLHTVGLR